MTLLNVIGRILLLVALTVQLFSQETIDNTNALRTAPFRMSPFAPGAGRVGDYYLNNSTDPPVLYKYVSGGWTQADSSSVIGLFATNAQTSTYQVLAADFTSCKTIIVSSGTFTITLVAAASQPTNGQCLTIINYGTGIVTLARSGQNINGAASNLVGTAGSATAPTGWRVYSDGTNYIAEVLGGDGYTASGASLPAACTVGQMFFLTGVTAGQNVYGCTSTNTWTLQSGGSSSVTMSNIQDCAATISTGTLTVSACTARNGSLDVSVSSCTSSLSGTSASGTVYAYLSGDGTFMLGHATAATLTCSGWSVASDVSAFPSDGLPLFTATFSSNVWNSGSVTPYRRLLDRDPYVAGSGLASSNNPSTGVTMLQVDSAQIPRYFAASGVPSQNCTQGRDFYLNTATSTLYQCTSTDTWASIGGGGGTITPKRYPLWGLLALNGGNTTSAFSANETRWHQFHLQVGMVVSGVGMRASTGLGASKGLRFAIADTSGTILHKTAVNTTCASSSLCEAAFSSAITLAAGVYYVGVTTDSTILNTEQSNAFLNGTVTCAQSDAGSSPKIAGTGTSGSGTVGSVDFGASMGTLTTYACNGGSNTLVVKFHDMYFY